MSRPILCLDFDCVLHSYPSGWKGADVIPDQPVPGAMKFIVDAQEHFKVAIFSSRSNQPGGIGAMHYYVHKHMVEHVVISGHDPKLADPIVANIMWPTEKPPAFLTIDDRAITFTGVWPEIETLKAFKPWNKR